MGDEYGLDPGPGQGPIYYPGDPGFPFPPPDPPPKQYPVGPAGRPAPYRAQSQGALPDLWAGVPGAVHDQAVALVEKFLSSVGWIQGIDANAAAQRLARSGINLTGSPYDAYEWLFSNILSGQQQVNNASARFGMLKDEYEQTVAKLNSVYFDWTGQQLPGMNTIRDGVVVAVGADSPLAQAIRGGWTPDEIRNWAMYGNPSGTGQMLASAQVTGEMPWLSQGQSYSQTLEGFQAFEQHAPTDRATLAAWFRFGLSAKQLAPSREAVARLPQQREQVSEVR